AGSAGILTHIFAQSDEARMEPNALNIANLHTLLTSTNALWTAGATPISQLSGPERQLRLGYVPGPKDRSLKEREQLAAARVAGGAPAAGAATAGSGAPSSFDWRNVDGKNFITPIRDQGGCGSCVAFGTIATVEGTARVTRHDPNLAIDLSEALLF